MEKIEDSIKQSKPENPYNLLQGRRKEISLLL